MPDRRRLTPEVADTRRVLRELLESQGIKNQRLLIGLSGGADSLSLTAAVGFEAEKLGIEPIAIIIDHGLQPNSAQVAENAKATAESLGVKAAIKKVEVGNQGGLENAARDARYEAFDEAMNEFDASFVLLGHNQNDQAESVLLGLMRGSGPKSIAGMKPVSGSYLRPFLQLSRDSLRQACADQEIEFWDDPQNQDSKFARVEIRKILGQLEASGSSGVIAGLARTADQMREAEEIIQPIVDTHIEQLGNPKVVSIEYLQFLDTALRRRIIHKLGQLNGVEFSRVHVLEIEKLVTNWHGQGPLSVPGITVERVGNNLHLD